MRSAAWQGVSCVSRRFFQAYIRKTLSPGLLQFGTARRTDSTQAPLQSRRYRAAEADRRPTCRPALLKESGRSPGLRAPCRDSAGKTQCLPLLRRPIPGGRRECCPDNILGGTAPNTDAADSPQSVIPTARVTVKCAARSRSVPCMARQNVFRSCLQRSVYIFEK